MPRFSSHVKLIARHSINIYLFVERSYSINTVAGTWTAEARVIIRLYMLREYLFVFDIVVAQLMRTPRQVSSFSKRKKKYLRVFYKAQG